MGGTKSIQLATNSQLLPLLQEPLNDDCSSLPFYYYDVRINSSEGEMVITKIVYEIIYLSEYLDYEQVTAVTINITVVNRGRQYSHPTVKTFIIQLQSELS